MSSCPARLIRMRCRKKGTEGLFLPEGGHGRELGRRAACFEGLTGRRVLLCDDGYTSGITAGPMAEALQEAGAVKVKLVALFATERTQHRPEEEQERLKWKAEIRRRRRLLRRAAHQEG